MDEKPLLLRPYLQVATICERHILEADGALTLFRIVDRFTVSGQTADMPSTVLAFTLVITFRSGPMRGRLPLRVQPINPSKKELPAMEFPLVFEGDDERYSGFTGMIQFPVDEEGLYWFVISLGEVEYTQVPLRVFYQKLPTIQTGN